jgi:hypothetical protein
MEAAVPYRTAINLHVVPALTSGEQLRRLVVASGEQWPQNGFTATLIPAFHYPTVKTQGPVDWVIENRFALDGDDHLQYGRILRLRTTELEAAQSVYLCASTLTSHLYTATLATTASNSSPSPEQTSWTLTALLEEDSQDLRTTKIPFGGQFHLCNVATKHFVCVTKQFLGQTNDRTKAAVFSVHRSLTQQVLDSKVQVAVQSEMMSDLEQTKITLQQATSQLRQENEQLTCTLTEAQQEIKAHEQDVRIIEDLHEEKNCIICMDQLREMLYLPCKHLCVCSGCDTALEKCPVCAQEITERQKVFMFV